MDNHWSSYMSQKLKPDRLRSVAAAMGLFVDDLRDGSCFAAGAEALQLRGARAGEGVLRRLRGQPRPATNTFTAMFGVWGVAIGVAVAVAIYSSLAENRDLFVAFLFTAVVTLPTFTVAFFPVAATLMLLGRPQPIWPAILATTVVASPELVSLWTTPLVTAHSEPGLPFLAIWFCLCAGSGLFLYLIGWVRLGLVEHKVYLEPPTAETQAVLEVLAGEPLESVAASLKVDGAVLQQWVNCFIEACQARIRKSADGTQTA